MSSAFIGATPKIHALRKKIPRFRLFIIYDSSPRIIVKNSLLNEIFC